MYLIVGLGNPEVEYENTRHNAGRTALSFFQKKTSFPVFVENKKFVALISEGYMGKSQRTVGIPTSVLKNKKSTSGEKVVLALPETMMNYSGKAVGALVSFYKIKPQYVIVLHDDSDIIFGNIKISFAKSSGGHRGVDSVRRALKTEKFWRIRIGIQPSIKKRVSAMDLVLRKFKPAEAIEFKKVTKKIIEALYMCIEKSPEQAMNRFN